MHGSFISMYATRYVLVRGQKKFTLWTPDSVLNLHPVSHDKEEEYDEKIMEEDKEKKKEDGGDVLSAFFLRWDMCLYVQVALCKSISLLNTRPIFSVIPPI